MFYKKSNLNKKKIDSCLKQEVLEFIVRPTDCYLMFTYCRSGGGGASKSYCVKHASK